MTAPVVSLATTNRERVEVHALFDQAIGGIDPNAVPKVEHDRLYDPIVAQIRDEEGLLLAAALTCRSQRAVVAARMATMLKAGVGDPTGVVDVVDLHSELDLIAVRASHRGQGLGSQLIRHLEQSLVQKGVRAWSGNVVDALNATPLRAFYERHGFEVLPDGQPLPKLLGRDWTPLQPTQPPTFSFYKLFGEAAAEVAAPRRVVRPPDPAKARRRGGRKPKKRR